MMKKSLAFLLLLWTLSSSLAYAKPRAVRVGVFQAAPLVFTQKGKPDGLFIDLIEHFSKVGGWTITYVPGTWNELLSSLEKGEIDLLPAVGLTDQRLSIYDFNKNPVFIDSGVLFSSKNLVLHTVYDLKGKRVAGVKGSVFTTGFIAYMKSFNIECELILTDDNRQVMEAIAKGKADAGVCIYSLGSVLAREFSIPITPISFSPLALEFAVPKGRNADLISVIDDQMAAMIGDPASFYSRAYTTWTSAPDSGALPFWLLWASLGLGGFALIVVIWSLSLRRQVAIKTGHLSAEIAERRHAEAEVRLLNADLEARVVARTQEIQAANKELESFAYSIAHDLRAPVRALTGFSQILMERWEAGPDSDNRHLLERILGNAKKMDELISGLLALAHAAQGEIVLKTIDMTSLAQKAYEEIADAETQRLFTCKLSPLPACKGDPVLLQQVWGNLLDNAIKYTRPKEERRIEVDGRLEDGMCVYSVKDSGVGFDEQYSSKLFGIFQRLHSENDFEGTGIGLSIVARIVGRHGGRVWAHGEVDKGATFYFSIPEQG
jgi:signal transduction histidine kinase